MPRRTSLPPTRPSHTSPRHAQRDRTAGERGDLRQARKLYYVTTLGLLSVGAATADLLVRLNQTSALQTCPTGVPTMRPALVHFSSHPMSRSSWNSSAFQDGHKSRYLPLGPGHGLTLSASRDLSRPVPAAKSLVQPLGPRHPGVLVAPPGAALDRRASVRCSPEATSRSRSRTPIFVYRASRCHRSQRCLEPLP